MKKSLLILLLMFSIYENYGQDIFTTLESKNYEILKELLEKGISTEQYNKKGLSPLWMAVYKNDTIALNLLLDNKADINFLGKQGMHPIMVGCIANSYESVKILLEKGVDVNWKSSASRNQQPIRFASQGGSLQLIKLLLEYGADIEATPDDKGTPLFAALHAKKYEIAKYYFDNGANVNVVGRDGECIIHEAIKTKNPEMVALALKYNAPLGLKDELGKTTWQTAKQSGNPQIKSMIKIALEKNK